MENYPLVSVICLCHNQEPYLQEAVESVLNQTYPAVELILVDDGSTDGSADRMRQLARVHHLEWIQLPQSEGNCRAFNKGYARSSGQFIVDLAADDVLLPERVQMGVDVLTQASAGVHFGDAEWVDASGRHLGYHRTKEFGIPEEHLNGDIFQLILKKFFISAPTMMWRKTVMEALNGYDESLDYEDFDFWVRSSRLFDYAYSSEVLVKKRQLRNSLSTQQRKFRSNALRTNWVVCRKIPPLLESANERAAFRSRIWTEIKQCIRWGRWEWVPRYLILGWTGGA